MQKLRHNSKTQGAFGEKNSKLKENPEKNSRQNPTRTQIPPTLVELPEKPSKNMALYYSIVLP